MTDLRVQAESVLIDWLGHTGAALGRALTPRAAPAHKDVPYGPLPEHRLDLWVPDTPGPHPVALFVHGGAFRVMSKDTHWMMSRALASLGFLTASINYRLAPMHRYPAAPQDVLRAWLWLQQHADDFNGDAGHRIVVGDSAGANLALSLVLCTCWRRPEPWAQLAFDQGLAPQAMVGIYGIYQVTNTGRYWQNMRHPRPFRHRIQSLEHDYLGQDGLTHTPGLHDLADPLLFLERTTSPPQHPLPRVLLPVGGRDPLMADSKRLIAALQQCGIHHQEHRVYPGCRHGFASFWWTPSTKKMWQDIAQFLG